MILWSYARLELAPPPAIADLLQQRVKQCLDDFTTQGLVNVLWALVQLDELCPNQRSAPLPLRPSAATRTAEKHGPDRRVYAALLARILAIVPDLKLIDVALVVSCIARVRANKEGGVWVGGVRSVSAGSETVASRGGGGGLEEPG